MKNKLTGTLHHCTRFYTFRGSLNKWN